MTFRISFMVEKLAYLCLAICPIIMAIYLLHYAIADFSSDAAMNSVLARVMYDSQSIFPRDWIISNGEGTFPSTAMLIAPLLKFFDNSFYLHAGFSLLLSSLLIWSSWLFLKTFPQNNKIQNIIFALLTMGFSYPFVRMVYVETAYFWWPFCFFVCAYLSYAGFSKSRHIYFYICALILFFFALKNPQRVAIMVIAPLMVYSFFLNFKPWSFSEYKFNNKQNRLYYILILFSAIASYAVVKILIQFKILNDLSVVSGLQLAGPAQIWGNFKVFFNGWFLYLGSDAEIYAYQSFEPFFRALRSTFVVAFTVFSFLGSVKYFRSENGSLRALSAAFVASFVLIFLLYIFTTSLAVNHLTMRYFTIPYLLAMILALIYIVDVFSRWKGFSLFVSICLISVTISGYSRLIPCPGLDCAPRQSHVMQIAKMLEKEGLDYGYAGWWIAGGPTILSKEKVFVAPVYITTENIVPFNYMVDKKWYEKSSQNRRKFIMLLDGEATPEVLSMLNGKFGVPDSIIRSTGVVVLVFNTDIIIFN